MSEPKPQPLASPEIGYDRHDAKAGIVAKLSFATLLILLAIIVFVWVFYVIAEDRINQEQVQAPVSEELKAIHAREEEQLNHYGYIDKEKGIVRLTIDRSIDLVAQEAAEGRTSYNTKTYPLRPDQPLGPDGKAAAPGAPPAGGPAQGGTTANAPAPAK